MNRESMNPVTIFSFTFFFFTHFHRRLLDSNCFLFMYCHTLAQVLLLPDYYLKISSFCMFQKSLDYPKLPAAVYPSVQRSFSFRLRLLSPARLPTLALHLAPTQPIFQPEQSPKCTLYEPPCYFIVSTCSCPLYQYIYF